MSTVIKRGDWAGQMLKAGMKYVLMQRMYKLGGKKNRRVYEIGVNMDCFKVYKLSVDRPVDSFEVRIKGLKIIDWIVSESAQSKSEFICIAAVSHNVNNTHKSIILRFEECTSERRSELLQKLIKVYENVF